MTVQSCPLYSYDQEWCSSLPVLSLSQTKDLWYCIKEKVDDLSKHSYWGGAHASQGVLGSHSNLQDNYAIGKCDCKYLSC